jgi:hypothetical protein
MARRGRFKRFMRKLGKTVKAVVPIAKVAGAFVPGVGPALEGIRGISETRDALRRARKSAHNAIRPVMGRGNRAFALVHRLQDVDGLDDATAARLLRLSTQDVRIAREIRRELGHDTGALEGAVWVVESGDTGSSISEAITGDPNRWRELKAANPKVAKRPDPNNWGLVAYPGESLTLPESWLPFIKPADVITPEAPPPISLPPVVSPPLSLPPVVSPPISLPPVAEPPISLPPTATPPTPAEPPVAEEAPPAQSGGGLLPLALAVGAWAFGLV